MEGRPMPCSSRARMRVASEYRAGGWVKCWSFENPWRASASPSRRAGSGDSFSSFSSSFPSSYTAVYPENFRLEELARKLWLPASTSTATLSYTALDIWQATKRLQIRRYRRYCSLVRSFFTCSGVRFTSLGRMASWASWAPALVL